mmetsp:Transcript_26782/g.37703  ORF Transcript_26782/g.37703 Transcript_26782/m.37703 type:complete len:212 (-) Transcript_26782:123-758(-)
MSAPRVDHAKQRVFFDQILLDADNQLCFDCGKQIKGNWAVMPHAVFICVECAYIHRRYIGTNYTQARSPTLDLWTQKQLDIMSVGGNARAKKYFSKYETDNTTSTVNRYMSSYASNYKNLLEFRLEWPSIRILLIGWYKSRECEFHRSKNFPMELLRLIAMFAYYPDFEHSETISYVKSNKPQNQKLGSIPPVSVTSEVFGTQHFPDLMTF